MSSRPAAAGLRPRPAPAAGRPGILADPARRMRWVVKPLLWAACLTPAAILGVRALQGDLTANPIEMVTHWTGFWALTLLVASLAVTPIRRLTGWNRIIQLRRPIGLFAFFYATLHFLTYLVLDQFFAWEYIVEDIVERPYITVGFTAFVLLIPVALTSTRGWIRRLGKNWTRLHRLVYVSAALGALHYLWKGKVEETWAFILAGAVVGLLLFRIIAARRRAARPKPIRRTAPAAPRSASTDPPPRVEGTGHLQGPGETARH